MSVNGSLGTNATDFHPTHVAGSLSQASEACPASFSSAVTRSEIIEFVELDAIPTADFP